MTDSENLSTTFSEILDMAEVLSIYWGSNGMIVLNCKDELIGFDLSGYDLVEDKELIIRSIKDAINKTG